jgi:predicted peptidase
LILSYETPPILSSRAQRGICFFFKRNLTPSKFLITATLSVAFLIAPSSPAFAAESHQTAHEIRRPVSRSVVTKYLLYIPAGFEKAGRKLPVIVYLHGGSVRGDDVEKLRTIGLPHRLEKDSSFPFIVIAPLCPAGEIWTDAEAVIGILDEVLGKYPADAHRVYLTGHSMGGRGALYIAYKFPERFSAVVAMSALSPINEWAARLSKTPIWYFHGVNDPLAPVADGDALVRAVETRGGDIKYTRLENRDHSILDVYEKAEWYQWLLEHRR